MKFTASRWSRRAKAIAVTIAVAAGFDAAWAEGVRILHVGDQETWLISAQGNLRDNASQPISFYGGIDRLATVVANRRADAAAQSRSVVTLNAGDAFIPGLRFNASLDNLATAHPDGGQDFYDAIAMRLIGFDAVVFGNHEFDLDNTGPIAARFAAVSGTNYLSVNIDFSVTPAFANLQAQGKVGASTIVTTAGGRKIGVVGVTTPLLPGISSPPAGILKNWSPTNTELQNLQALLPLVQAEVDDLRNNRGANAIVVVSHLQNARNELDVMIPGLRGVDLVISGGGHELMAELDDPLIDGGVAPSFTQHPTYATDLDGKAVPMVTGHFGNRYVGEIDLTLDDTTGAVTSVDNSRMIRVSGRPTDPDRVTGDPTLFNQVVAPVSAYVAAKNAQVIGRTSVRLNAARSGACSPAPCQYVEGIRKSETNLGNLVADSLRHFGGTDVAIQNGGGIRAEIAGPGNITLGDTFNVLSFTNLVKIAPAITAAQLKDVLEHALSGSTPTGVEQGRFPQISGMRVEYDTTRAARPNTAGNTVATVGQGERVRRIVLDDGSVLVDNGVVVDPGRTVSLSTIDFLANGGDNYPFPANGVAFVNTVNTITYQEALARFIQTPKAAGGLKRAGGGDGDEVTGNAYARENAFDRHGRLVDLAVAAATPGVTRTGTAGRDVIVGTAGDDMIVASAGADTLTGGAGGDVFRYTSLREAGDTIIDFTPHADRIDLTPLLASLGVAGNGTATGHVRFADVTGGVQILIDTDGSAGPAQPRPLVTLKGLTAAQMAPGRDFVAPVLP